MPRKVTALVLIETDTLGCLTYPLRGLSFKYFEIPDEPEISAVESATPVEKALKQGTREVGVLPGARLIEGTRELGDLSAGDILSTCKVETSTTFSTDVPAVITGAEGPSLGGSSTMMPFGRQLLRSSRERDFLFSPRKIFFLDFISGRGWLSEQASSSAIYPACFAGGLSSFVRGYCFEK